MCDSRVNGEYLFFSKIKNHINIIFDVGCNYASDYLEFEKEVHYFDPEGSFVEKLSQMTNLNSTSTFNNFGLGKENNELYYFPMFQSFFNRIKSCEFNDDANKVMRTVKTGKSYVTMKNIETIDFLKIDTEGDELNVLLGFEDFLPKIGIIQFEFGGTFIDNDTTLSDVVEYLKTNGFHKFSYLTSTGAELFTEELITDFQDHYTYCNIVCVNQNSVYDSIL